MSAEFTSAGELMVEIERLKAELAVAHSEISSLRHDAELTERQMELMLDSQRIGTEARATLHRDITELTAQRDALLRAITAPGTLTDRDRVRLAVLGVNL